MEKINKRDIRPTDVNFVSNGKVVSEKVDRIEGASSKGHLEIKPLLVSQNVLFMEVHRRKGLIDTEHSHQDHESICYLVSGRMRVHIEDEEFIADPGDTWIHRPGVRHYHEAIEDSVQIEVKVPPKKTWK